jgi:competence protein ComEC
MRSFAAFVLAGFAAGIGVVQTLAALPGAATIVLTCLAAGPAAWVAWRVHSGSSAAGPGRSPALVALVLAALAGMPAGAGYALLRAEARLADRLPPAWEGRDIVVTGVVDDLPHASERGTRFALAVEQVLTDGAIVPARIALVWPAAWQGGVAADEVPDLAAGERWRLTLRLKAPHGYANPHGFDLEGWMLERNLRASGYVRHDPANERLALHAGRWRDHVARLRERVRERIAAALPGADYAGVVAALAIGDQRAIPEAQWTAFNRTGIGHLVSISGLHVTALAAIAGLVVTGLARRSVRLTDRLPARKAGTLAAVGAAFIYMHLAGAEIPAQRTFAMLAVAATALMLSRGTGGGLAWLWALAAVLALDPWAVLAPGFWLSYGAVALLIVASAGRVAEAPGASALRRCLRSLREAAHTQYVVTVGLVPFTLALFGQVSLVSPLANAVAIPVVTFAVVPLAVGGILLPVDAAFVAAHAILVPLMAFVEALARWPPAAWSQHAPPAWTLAAAAAGVAWLLAPRGVPSRALGLVWLAPLALVLPDPPPHGSFRLTVLDAGQGLASIVRTHAHTLVYDTGPRWHEHADAGSRIVLPYLRGEGLRRIDTLVVSHQDLDHAGGAMSLIDGVPVGVLLSSMPDDHPLVEAIGPARARRCVAGQRWTFDGVDFEILHPTPAEYADARVRSNDRSCVLRVSAGSSRVLLAGDIEGRSEAKLLREQREALAAALIVVPHHGSRTSSSAAFVAAVDPAFAIVTTGYRNRFGHPRPEVVARYAARGATVLRTDHHGAIVAEVSPAGLGQPVRERERSARYWRAVPQARAPPLD